MLVRVTGVVLALAVCLLSSSAGLTVSEFELRSTIAVTSTRDNPLGSPLVAAEIYLLNDDGTDPRRLTDNAAGDAFPVLSPDGKKIVFDSNRNFMEGQPRTPDLFLMNTDGSEQTFLIRGSSAGWSPDSRNLAFHASASGLGEPIRPDPGAPTTDSDIFIVNVDDLLAGVGGRINLTNSPDDIEDDADWSPDGQRILFTSHPVTDNPNVSIHAEVYVMNADGSGVPERLTFNEEEERAPSWSPDGTRIVFNCRWGGADLEVCVMNADGSDQQQLTTNTVVDATPTYSPDGGQIVFHRLVAGRFQLFLMNSDGSDQAQLTDTPGLNLFANWGELRVHVEPAGTRLRR